LLSSSSREHSGSSLAPFRHPAQLWHIIDSIYHRDSEVLDLEGTRAKEGSEAMSWKEKLIN
jgi:hypothetical protein